MLGAHAVDERPAVRKLLEAIKRDHVRLTELVEPAASAWSDEDLIYRFWHQSFKVYDIQRRTKELVDALKALAPDGCQLNSWFETIIAEGTGQTFDVEHNRRWQEVARPMLEAFFHARFMVQMAVKYGREFEDPPALLPSGWAALLYLYDLR